MAAWAKNPKLSTSSSKSATAGANVKALAARPAFISYRWHLAGGLLRAYLLPPPSWWRKSAGWKPALQNNYNTSTHGHSINPAFFGLSMMYCLIFRRDDSFRTK